MSMFAINILNGLILSRESLEKLFTPHISENNRGIMWRGYGFGIEKNNEFGTIITHNGGGMSGNSIISYFIDHDTWIIILGNRIEFRLLFGLIPYYIDFPADQLSNVMASAIFSGNFAGVPRPILPFRLGITILITGFLAIFGILVLIIRLIRKK